MAAVESLDFGTLLRRCRRAACLTQEELAEQAGLSVRGISDLERGVKHRPHKDTVQLLADALKLSGEERDAFEGAARGLGAPSGPLLHAEPLLPNEAQLVSIEAEPFTDVRIFLIADVRDYTRFTVEHGDEAAAKVAARFASLARRSVAAHGGEVIELRGDEALAVFSSTRQALRAAIDLQERLGQETMADTNLPLKAGIGLDAGEAIPIEGGYRGGALNLAARLCSLAGPGEVLASEGVVHLARKTEGLAYLERGTTHLKGFADPVRVLQVVPDAEQPVVRAADDAQPAEVVPPLGGFLGALAPGLLIGREQELTRVLSALETVAGGPGQFVLLAGEPGVGKTRLAQEVTKEARNRGFLVATGRCYGPEQAVPFYPFLEALAAAYAAAPPGTREEVPHRWPYLGWLLPDLTVAPPAPPSGTIDEQQRLFRAISGFLQAVAEKRPVALLLDDLQWADTSSVQLLRHLGHHTRTSRILLLGTYRDVEIGRHHPLQAALVDLQHEQLVVRLAVHRLASEETAALLTTVLAGEVSAAVVSLVHKATEGNPFFIQEVIRTLVERGDVYQENSHWTRREVAEIEVPESVQDAIHERLSRLSVPAQEVLHEASILGQTFCFEDLHRLAGKEEQEVEEVLEEAAAVGLVQEGDFDTYSFNHTLTQQALYNELSPRRRRRLHLAAAEVLELHGARTRPQRAAELAWHLRQGGAPERALPYTLLAGDQARTVFAHSEAEQHYRAAGDLAIEVADEGRQVEAWEKLGAVLTIVGRYDEALVVLERAVNTHQARGDHEGVGRVTAQIGRVHFARGTPDEGIARLQPVVGLLQGNLLSPTLAALETALARLFFGSGRYEESVQAAQLTSDLARGIGDDRLLAEAEEWRGAALALLGRQDEAVRALEGAIPLAESAGDLETLNQALNNVGCVYMLRGEFDESRTRFERSLEFFERLGSPGDIEFVAANLGEVFFYLGDWTQARRHLEKAVDVVRSAGSTWHAAYPLFVLGQLCVAEGEWDEASRHLEECVAIAARSHDLQALRFGQRALAEKDVLEGNPEAACARLDPVLDRPGLEEQDVTPLLPVLAWAHLEMGEQDRGEDIVMLAIRRATAQNNRLALVTALWVSGIVLSRQSRWQEAERALEEAVSLARTMPYPYAEARASYQYGLMHVRRGEPRQSRERLEQALAIFRRLGARPYTERTQQALTELGAT